MNHAGAGSPVLDLRLPVWRIRFVLLLLLLTFAGLAGRALYLQGLRNDFLQAKGDARYSRVIEISANRGVISDRHGKPLAISTPVASIWVSPADLQADDAKLRELAAVLNLPRHELRARLAERGRDFVYLKRQLPPDQADRVMALGIPGVFRQQEYRRYYPGGDSLAHLLGFTGVDQHGLEGIELAWEEQLEGKPGARRVIKDRRGHIVEEVGSLAEPQEGQAVALSIDASIQSIAYTQLRQTVSEQRARAGSVVVLDVQTGEVLALANVPSYNPNNRGTLSPSRSRNRAVVDVYEPGSTMKPFTIAAALEAGAITTATQIDTGPGTLTIGPATIRDAHSVGTVNPGVVIQKSSNVGAAKIALMLPAEKLWQQLHRTGFGNAPGSGFPGEAGGRLRPWKSWRPIEQATIAYGHGISVSLLQLARAYTVFAGDGSLKPLSLLKLDSAPLGERVIGPETAKAVRGMLEMAVQPGGTAIKAQVPGYRVAGKTGTAHKVEGAGYAADRYVSSFIGFAPASAPRLLVAVMIDEPGAGQYYGGAVAAPLFREIMSGALRLLAVPPDARDDGLTVPIGPEIPEEV